MADLSRACDRIAQDKPAVAEAFAAVVFDKVERLREYPLLGRTGAFEDTRELIVHKNFLVTYRVRSDEVQMLQVWHLARNLPRGGGR